MNKFLRCSIFRPSSQLTYCLAVVLAGSFNRVEAQSSPFVVGCVVKGQLQTQSLMGGRLASPSSSQKLSWRQENENSQKSHIYSKRGSFDAYLDRESSNEPRFTGIRDAHLKLVLSEAQLTRLVTPPRAETAGTPLLRFGGWVSDSHVAVATEESDQENQLSRRAVVNVSLKRLIRFNGWPSPKPPFALVPDQETFAKAHYTSEGYYVGGTHRFKALPPRLPRYYAVRLSGSLDTYRFKSVASKQLLRYGGKPFDIGLSSGVVFSPDGRWAIINRRVPDAFLVQLSNGKVRKLPGQNAGFLLTKTPVPTKEDILIRPGVGVGRLRLGMTRQQVGAILGAPTYRYYGHKIYGGLERDSYPDYVLGYANNRLAVIDIESPRFKTAEGLSIRSRFSSIQSRLGPLSLLRDNPFDIIVLHYASSSRGIGFGFEATEPKEISDDVPTRMNQAFVDNSSKMLGIGVFRPGIKWKRFLSSE